MYVILYTDMTTPVRLLTSEIFSTIHQAKEKCKQDLIVVLIELQKRFPLINMATSSTK